MKEFLKGWYVIYVRSRHEKKVRDALTDAKIECFLPLVKSESIWSDRKKMLLKPLFPSYVFAYISNKQEFYKAQNANGFCYFVSFNSAYALARNEEILQIKKLLNAEGIAYIQAMNKPLSVGEQVQIDEGPLAGLRCEIVRVDKQEKLLVRLNSIHQNLLVSVPQKAVLSNTPSLTHQPKLNKVS
ncbi:UpxY family transcription antiterminator [Flavobacteriaceae bacterium M23B6Z8]